ncbi:MAG: GDSL-type esterase/lipase family protein [Melioribacteraceae bacterium]|nr:GDSL-type esterase/lipase family protein [Melioribacteraceae bacterium]
MKKFLLIILYIFLFSNLAAQSTYSYLQNPIYQRQIEFYKIYKPVNTKVVMLGNSLTHGVDWNMLLGRNDVTEMGIVSDVLSGYYNRLTYVTKLKPKVCFVLGGLNDLYQWIPVETIFEDYQKVIERLQRNGITVVIQSTLYAGRDWGKDWLAANNPEANASEVNAERNIQVDRLNNLLKNYAAKNNIEYIDLNSLMSRGNFLRSELTYDGVHLNAAGYKIWGREVEETLKKLGL